MKDTLINLANILCDNQRQKQIDFALDMSDVNINGSYPFIENVDVESIVDTKDYFAIFKAEVSFRFVYPCDRCAQEIDKIMKMEFQHKLVNKVNDDANDDDYIVADNGNINLSEIIKEDIILNLPTKILCRDDCKGICPICGKNLNLGDCNCNTKEIDPRLEKLKELLI